MTDQRSRPLTALDERMLSMALSEAEKAIGLSDPNPRVGCIIGSADGRVLASGSTQRAGEAHAEAMALASAAANGVSVAGATAWVTLEPCAHHGRTPPCCDALIKAGLARVVIAAPDPFPAVNGEGMRRLKAAGIEVCMADGTLLERAREINIGFFSRVERGRPWVRMKIAMSLDGRTALSNGRSQWITSEPARTDGHLWRKRATAVLTGSGTVLADDPRLDVRLVPSTLQPLRVVLDSDGRVPPAARILQTPGRALVYSAPEAIAPPSDLQVERRKARRAAGGLDLLDVLRDLASLEVNELHVEAGPTLNAAFLSQGLVDELLIYVAPTLLGPGRPAANLPSLHELPPAAWRYVEFAPVGPDLRLRLRPAAGSSAG